MINTLRTVSGKPALSLFESSSMPYFSAIDLSLSVICYYFFISCLQLLQHTQEQGAEKSGKEGKNIIIIPATRGVVTCSNSEQTLTISLIQSLCFSGGSTLKPNAQETKARDKKKQQQQQQQQMFISFDELRELCRLKMAICTLNFKTPKNGFFYYQWLSRFGLQTVSSCAAPGRFRLCRWG